MCGFAALGSLEVITNLFGDQIVIQKRHTETIPELVVVTTGETAAKGGEVVGDSLEVIVEIVGPVLFLGIALYRSFFEVKIFETDDVITWGPGIGSTVTDPYPIVSVVVRDSVLDGRLPLTDQVGEIALL